MKFIKSKEKEITQRIMLHLISEAGGQVKLGEILDCTQGHISRLKNGSNNILISENMACDIENIFGIPAKEIRPDAKVFRIKG